MEIKSGSKNSTAIQSGSQSSKGRVAFPKSPLTVECIFAFSLLQSSA